MRRCSQRRFQTVNLFRPRSNFLFNVDIGVLELKKEDTNVLTKFWEGDIQDFFETVGI